MILEHDFALWFRGENHRKDMDDIRDVCSEYFHGDSSFRRRNQTLALFLCSPIWALDQLTSSAAMVLFSPILIPARLTFGISWRMESFFWGLAKSVGAIISALLYYSIWIMGNDVAKFCVVAILVVNQALYSSILCRMSASEFLVTVIFRGIFSVTLMDRKGTDEGMKYDVEADNELATKELNEEATEKDQSIVASFEVEDVTEGGERESVLAPKSDGGSTKASSTSSQNDETVPTGCNPFSVFALPGSRGAKSIDFTGSIYSARVGDQSVESNSLADTFATFPTIFQEFKRKLELGIMAAMGPATPRKENQVDVPSFIRSGTEVSSLSRDQSYLQMSAMTDDPTLVKVMGNIGGSPSILDPSANSQDERRNDDQESIAIVGDIESSRDLTNFRDPRVIDSAAPSHEIDPSSNSDVDTVSIHILPEGRPHPGGNVFQATTDAIDENEAPPPDYALNGKKGQRQSILDMLFPSGSNSTSAEHSLKEKASLSKSSALPEKTSKTSVTKNVVMVPEHVNMMRMVGSVDEEDLTFVGFDTQAPDRSPPRGRRPAPGKVDLPNEHQFVF